PSATSGSLKRRLWRAERLGPRHRSASSRRRRPDSPMSANESSAQREALAIEALRRGGRVRLKVWGESMLPALFPGDTVEVAACALAGVRRGEAVLALRDGRFYLHRFLGSHDGGFRTRGDSVPKADPSFPADALLGKLVAVSRGESQKKVM